MRVRYRDIDVNILARIMRAEAQGEGVFGQKLVGNVVVNRVSYTCKPFKKINTIYDAVMQPNQFEGINKHNAEPPSPTGEGAKTASIKRCTFPGGGRCRTANNNKNQ